MVRDSSEIDQPYFEDSKEEVNYWKQIAEEYIQKYVHLIFIYILFL